MRWGDFLVCQNQFIVHPLSAKTFQRFTVLPKSRYTRRELFYRFLRLLTNWFYSIYQHLFSEWTLRQQVVYAEYFRWCFMFPSDIACPSTFLRYNRRKCRIWLWMFCSIIWRGLFVITKVFVTAVAVEQFEAFSSTFLWCFWK